MISPGRAIPPDPLHVPTHPVRVVTAASLFDGHDAAINIMRRILQAQGAEVIHLGHNRTVDEVVDAVVEEDADAVAVSSYQGGHIEYFTYLVGTAWPRGAHGHVRVYGGGGGVIVADEIEALAAHGVRIFSPDRRSAPRVGGDGQHHRGRVRRPRRSSGIVDLDAVPTGSTSAWLGR